MNIFLSPCLKQCCGLVDPYLMGSLEPYFSAVFFSSSNFWSSKHGIHLKCWFEEHC
jgi:hypothetical protein